MTPSSITNTAGTWTVPALYTDSAGAEVTLLSNDGEHLRMQLRGVVFESDDFESFMPVDSDTSPSGFSLHYNALCDYTLSCAFGVLVQNRGVAEVAMVHMNLELGGPDGLKGLSHLHLKLSLVCTRGEYNGSGLTGFFELELNSILSQLPHDLTLHSCLTCQFSDYSPYGQGLFGGLMCFESIREDYLKTNSKQTFWSVHDRYDRFVQETYICSSYEPRLPGTGYRG